MLRYLEDISFHRVLYVRKARYSLASLTRTLISFNNWVQRATRAYKIYWIILISTEIELILTHTTLTQRITATILLKTLQISRNNFPLFLVFSLELLIFSPRAHVRAVSSHVRRSLRSLLTRVVRKARYSLASLTRQRWSLGSVRSVCSTRYVCSSVRNSVPHLLTFPPLTTFLTPSSTSSHLPPLRSVLRTSLRYGRCSSLRKVLVTTFVTESAARTRARGFRNRPLGAFSVARPRICTEKRKIIPRDKILGLEVKRPRNFEARAKLFRNNFCIYPRSFARLLVFSL